MKHRELLYEAVHLPATLAVIPYFKHCVRLVVGEAHLWPNQTAQDCTAVHSTPRSKMSQNP